MDSPRQLSNRNKIIWTLESYFAAVPWQDCVVPLPVKGGSLEMDLCELFISEFDPLRVGALVNVGIDVQPSFSVYAANQIDNDGSAHERSGAPILGDVTEHTVLDLVPFTG